MRFYCLIVGSRGFTDYNYLEECCDYLLKNKKEIIVISGGAKGTDNLAKKYAYNKGYEYIEFIADWERYGKGAGYIRNTEMHKYISQFDNRGVIAFWDGKSKGTKHNFELCKKYNNDIVIIDYVKNCVM